MGYERNYYIAAALDPRFWRMNCFPKLQKKIQEHMEEKINAYFLKKSNNLHLNSNISSSSVHTAPQLIIDSWLSFKRTEDADEDECSKVRDDILNFINLSKMCDAKVSLLQFWKDKSNAFPTLMPLCKKYLCIPITSCDCEGIFSRSGYLCNKRRSSMKPKTIKKYIFLSECYRSEMLN